MRLLLVVVAGSLAPVLAGCGGGGRPAVVPAWGKVLLKQRDGALVPMGGAKLVFAPVAGGESLPAFPAARAAADGSFRLGTFGADDGAPVGEYVVTVEWKERQRPQYDVMNRGEVDRGRDKLGGKYADRSTSSLRATVAAGQELTLVVPAP